MLQFMRRVQRKITSHYKTRRVLLNFFISAVLLFLLYINEEHERNDLVTIIDHRWTNDASKMAESNETDPFHSTRLKLIHEIKKKIAQDIENMSPQIGLVEGQSYAKILLISNWRSGGAFISSIVGAYPATLQHQEVLKVIVGMHRVDTRDYKRANDSVTHLKRLLSCHFHAMHESKIFSPIIKSVDLKVKVLDEIQYFASNVLSKFCTTTTTSKAPPNSICGNPQLLESICRLYPIHVFKLDRLYLEVAKKLLDESAHSPWLKIVYLVRDPRAIHSSRQQVGWCKKEPICREAKTLCKGLVEDFNSAVDLQAQYPHRVKIVRYEDLINDLSVEIPKFLSSLGLAVQPSIKKLLLKNSSPNEVGESQFNPRETMYKWKFNLMYPEVVRIQNVCSDALQLWQYKLVQSDKHLTQFDVVQDFAIFD